MIARIKATILALGISVTFLSIQTGVAAELTTAVVASSYKFKVDGDYLGYDFGYFESCTGMGLEIAKSGQQTEKTGIENVSKQLKLIYSNIVCSREISSDRSLWDWAEELKNYERFPEYLIITLYGKDKSFLEGVPIARWKVWWPRPTEISVVRDGNSFKEQVVFIPEIKENQGIKYSGIERLSELSDKPYSQKQPNLPKSEAGMKLIPKVIPNIQPATGYKVGKSAAPSAPQQLDLSGLWKNDLGSEYQINQQGQKITYQDPILNLPVSGTVAGKTVSVSWSGGSVKGTITKWDNEGRANRIEWDNGIIFRR
jgi:hypothetical protein